MHENPSKTDYYDNTTARDTLEELTTQDGPIWKTYRALCKDIRTHVASDRQQTEIRTLRTHLRSGSCRTNTDKLHQNNFWSRSNNEHVP